MWLVYLKKRRKREFGNRDIYVWKKDNMKTYMEKVAMWLEWCFYEPSMPRIISKHKKLQDARKYSPLETCWCLDFILLVSRTMRQWIFVVLSHPVFGICYGSRRKLIQWPCVQVLLIKKKGTTNNFCHWPEKAVQISFNKYLLSAYCICYPMGNHMSQANEIPALLELQVSWRSRY